MCCINLKVEKKKTVTEPPAQKTVTEPPAQTIADKPLAATEATEGSTTRASGETPQQSGNGTSSIVKSPGISIKDSLKAGSVPGMPVDSCASDAEEEDKLTEEKSALADPGAIIHAWKDYAASLEKLKPRIYSTLVNNKPVVRADGSVMVMLNSEAQRDNFIKNIKPKLVAYIKEATDQQGVEIITEVAESTQNGNKIYTEQDKMDYMLRKNPELGKLKTRFNLDFDD